MSDLTGSSLSNIELYRGTLRITDIDFNSFAKTIADIIESIDVSSVKNITFTNCQNIYMRDISCNLRFESCDRVTVQSDSGIIYMSILNSNNVDLFVRDTLALMVVKGVSNLSIIAHRLSFLYEVKVTDFKLITINTFLKTTAPIHNTSIEYFLCIRNENRTIGEFISIEYSNLPEIAKYTLIQVDQYLVSLHHMKHYVVNTSFLRITSYEVNAEVLLQREAIKNTIPYLL